MMAAQEIGRVKGKRVYWNEKTGEVYVKSGGFFPTVRKLEGKAKTMTAAFALAESVLRSW